MRLGAPTDLRGVLRDDPHDPREALPADRAPAPGAVAVPNARGAGDAEAAVAALDEDRVGWGIEADYARVWFILLNAELRGRGLVIAIVAWDAFGNDWR